MDTNQTQIPIQQPSIAPQQQDTSSGKKGMILLGGLVFIVVIGAMLYYIMTPKPKSPLPTPSSTFPLQQTTPSTSKTSITPPSVSDDIQLQNLDTGDPGTDLEDLQKDLSSL